MLRLWLCVGFVLAGCTKAPSEEGEDRDGDGFEAAADCDDADAAVNPDAIEACNAVDDDCDEQIDEEAGGTFFTDGDADGFGDDGAPVTACEIGAGQSATGGDCDDADGAVNPEAAETCNEVDDDCDGVIDNGVSELLYGDTDGDGFGDGCGSGHSRPLSRGAAAHDA